jgi:hypothetical protein
MFYLAECYLPAETAVAGVAEQAQAGAERAAKEGADVAFVEAIFVPQDESCFLVYRACCAADVTMAGSLARLVFDRISGAVVSGGGVQ